MEEYPAKAFSRRDWLARDDYRAVFEVVDFTGAEPGWCDIVRVVD